MIVMRIKKTLIIKLVNLVFICVLFFGCSDESPSGGGGQPGSSGLSAKGGGFTFLDLGVGTRYSRSLRERLKESLGPDALLKRTTIDLETNYPGFLKDYAAPIDQYNRQLNDARGARVEHDTIKLLYRYPQKKSRLFKKVQLLFSGESKKPLFFDIVSRKEGSGILETMREKYGPPKEITWSDQPGQSYFWQSGKDYLIVSRVTDRFGDPEYRISIYYGDNIETLIKREKERIRQKEDRRKEAGKSAF